MGLAATLLAACLPDDSGAPEAQAPARSQPPSAASVLATLRRERPRLLLRAGDLDRVRDTVAADKIARRYRDALAKLGEELLDAPALQYELAGSDGLLGVSREAVDRIYILGLLYQIDGDRRWADRGARELRAVSAFPDWNPAHFLDTAEMAHAVGIGYDWLYDALSADDRAIVRGALVDKGLRPAQEGYAAGAWWATDPSNWNNVCNGGIAVGALALADEEPVLASALLVDALGGLPHALASYAPDGAWAEGPSYWSYATRYTVVALAALGSALGTDFGLSDSPGLPNTGMYRLQAVGPSGLYCNFADSEEKVGDDPALFWLARRYRQPAYAVAGRTSARRRPSARDLLWFEPAGGAADLDRLPLDSRFAGAEQAFFRSSWSDTDALYLAVKGGDNQVSHAHLDLGTFVLDALGQRWAIDLGRDGYSLSGYFGRNRWTYYRVRTEGHNTLTFGGENQPVEATAPLVAFESTRGSGFAILDLTAAYADAGVTAARRGVALFDNRRRVLIQDEITAGAPLAPTWAMHTLAAVHAEGDQATLTQGGVMVAARILAPAGARFEVEPVDLPKPQKPTEGVSKLVVRLPEPAASTQVAVVFAPGTADAGSANVVALDEWGRAGPS
jgi:hypothetical protein